MTILSSYKLTESKVFTIGQVKIRFNLLIAICIVLTVSTFIRLGIWQLGRADEKRQLQQEVDSFQGSTTVEIENVDYEKMFASNALNNLNVSLSGHYLNDFTVLIAAQFFRGQIGYEIVTPFQLESNDEIILVSRGWTTAIIVANTKINLRPLTGPLNLTALVHVPKSIPPPVEPLGDKKWPLEFRNLNVNQIASHLEKPVFPFVVRLNESSPGVFARHWPAVSSQTGMNISYAIQWFGFAGAVVFLSLFFSSNIFSLMKEKMSSINESIE